MKGTESGLAIIAEARTVVNRIEARVANISDGRGAFPVLTDELDCLMQYIADVETHLQSAPVHVPISISAVFIQTLASVCDVLNRCNSTLAIFCYKVFPGSSTSGISSRPKSEAPPTARTEGLSDLMNALQEQVHRASTQLLAMIPILVAGLKSQEQQDAIVPKLHSMRDSVMDGADFGLEIIAEARALTNSIKTRTTNIRDAQDIFRRLHDDLNRVIQHSEGEVKMYPVLVGTNSIEERNADIRSELVQSMIDDELDRLMRHIGKVETRLQSAPAPMPLSISAVFNVPLASARDILNSTLETVCSKSFYGSSSDVSPRTQSRLRRTGRDTALPNTMNLEAQVKCASNQLLALISKLDTGLISDETSGNDDLEELYRVAASTPALPQGADLDFGAKDRDGKHSTPEGLLKESILSTKSAKAGVITPALGVVGMTGVGKTIALRGLAFDDDIRIRFPGGIQYIALGPEATLLTVRGEIANIMRLSGASASISAVLRSSSLEEAVDYAVAWFNGKNCLFLVDDLWPTDDCQTGFLTDLLQLSRCSSESRMAITTRSVVIAQSAGHTVAFGPRDPLGSVSVKIFMSHAAQDAKEECPHGATSDLRRSIATILTVCAGLPRALAVAGHAVAFLAKEQGDFESACDSYALELGKERTGLGELEVPGGSSSNAEIALSLKILEAEFGKLKKPQALGTNPTISDLYTSLCVLRNPDWVPVRVLRRMWKVNNDFAMTVVLLLSELSLCRLNVREDVQGAAKEGSLMLHDVQLDYCKRHAEAMKTSSLWHTRLLNGYLEPVSGTSKDSLMAEHGDSYEQVVLAYVPRPWWFVPDDGYIHMDLARHLLSADLTVELAALLLNSRWTHVRAEIGGISALKSDFECLLTLGGELLPHSARQSFELILKAIQVSWGRRAESPRALLFQLCGRHFNLRTDNAIVNAYLRIAKIHTPMPYLLPVNQFFSDTDRASVMEIPVGSQCVALDCSPCGRYVAAGVGTAIVVADATTGDILKRLDGSSDAVSCVSFVVGSTKIVSGSWDETVALWEWESSEWPVLVFNGHTAWVRGVAVSSDGLRIFSCSHDRTLRIWDANTGAEIGEFVHEWSVRSLAVSFDDQFVAVGLLGGALKVMDSCTGATIFEDVCAHDDHIISVAFSAKGQRLASVSRDKTIRLWDTATWTRIGEPFRGHTLGVSCVTFSPDGEHIASGSADGSVRLWDANTGRSIWTSENVHNWVNSVAFTPDGERMIFASGDGIIRIWNTPLEAEANQVAHGHSAPVQAVVISHDGLRVASGSKDRTVCLWDSLTGNQIGRPLDGHTDWVTCVSFSHDGRQVVSGSFDKTVRLWDVEAFIPIKGPLRGHTDLVSCVCFSWDGLRIFSGSRDKTIRIWDVRSGIQLGNTLEGHAGAVLGVSESRDGSHVVSRDDYGEVVLWNRDKRTIAWKSEKWRNDSEHATGGKSESAVRHTVTDEEAKKIICSCGQEAPHLWPKSFPAYSAEVYCRGGFVYSNAIGGETLLGTLPSLCNAWKYNERRKLLAAGLQSGSVAICELKTDGGYSSAVNGASANCKGRCPESTTIRRVQDTPETPLCYFNCGENVSTMFSSPSGGEEELYFSNLVTHLSRMHRFDNNEADYVPSDYRNNHDECSREWEDILTDTRSIWSSLKCSEHEKKWNVDTHDGHVLFKKKQSESFIIFMCDFFMAYDEESDLLLIIVPLSKAIVLAPANLSMNKLLDEVAEEQVHLIARRLVQLTSMSWDYSCLARLEQELPGGQRLGKITNLFDGKSLDLEPCSLEALVGCRVGLIDGVLLDVPYSRLVGLEISGTVIRLILAPNGIAYPVVEPDTSLTFDDSITDYIDISIGGDHDEVKPLPDGTENTAQQELNLSYVPQNKNFECLREQRFNHPEDLEKAFIELGYGEQFSHVLRRAATTHLCPEKYTLEQAQGFVLRSWRNCSHRNLVPLTFHFSRKKVLRRQTPFLVINNGVVYVVKSHKNIQKSVTLGLNTNFAAATFGRASSDRDITMLGPVCNLLDAAEQLHGVPTGFDHCGGPGNWYKVHRQGMSNILCALTFVSVMLKGKVNPCGEFGGCVPRANPDGQKVDFNIPVPYGLARSTFAAGYKPDTIIAGEERGPIYRLNGPGWDLECNYTIPAVLAEPSDRKAVEDALLAERLERASTEGRGTALIEPGGRSILRETKRVMQTVIQWNARE